ncbi:GcrA family cell cycle regulator [Mesorhizobium huakuii]|uniref:GcrA family cell cycle regulator n=1 Tax=Mesorhizobium huakuii TaxID=28104 RepID=UPI001FD342D7|nr:GcrA family cell cycle regulator [Mesorhizobium huakuii]
MNWTDERVELLRKLWSEGLSASQIAAQLGGVSRNAVIGKVHRLKLSGAAAQRQRLHARRRRHRDRPFRNRWRAPQARHATSRHRSVRRLFRRSSTPNR